jgi:hypothetical protein
MRRYEADGDNDSGTDGGGAVPTVTANEERAWWEAPWFLALVVVATTIPLLYPPIPPLVDLLVHMGRYRF